MFIKTMIYYQNSKTPSLISVCVKIKSDQNLRKMLLKMIQTMVVLYIKNYIVTVPKVKMISKLQDN